MRANLIVLTTIPNLRDELWSLLNTGKDYKDFKREVYYEIASTPTLDSVLFYNRFDDTHNPGYRLNVNVDFATLKDGKEFFAELLKLIKYICLNESELHWDENSFAVSLNSSKTFDRANFPAILIKDWSCEIERNYYLNTKKFLICFKSKNPCDCKLAEKIIGISGINGSPTNAFFSRKEFDEVLKRAKIPAPLYPEIANISFADKNTIWRVTEREEPRRYVFCEETEEILEAKDLFGTPIISVNKDKGGSKQFSFFGFVDALYFTEDERFKYCGVTKYDNFSFKSLSNITEEINKREPSEGYMDSIEECEKFYIHADNGKLPRLISKDKVNKDMPCGMYIVYDYLV